MISIENIQYIEWALIIGFVLGIVTVVVGYMDMKKKSKKMKETSAIYGTLIWGTWVAN